MSVLDEACQASRVSPWGEYGDTIGLQREAGFLAGAKVLLKKIRAASYGRIAPVDALALVDMALGELGVRSEEPQTNWGSPIRYETELTYTPNNRCFGWSYVLYRVEAGEREVVVAPTTVSGTREIALEHAREAAVADRAVRVFSPATGRSFNVHLGPGNGEAKRRETVEL